MIRHADQQVRSTIVLPHGTGHTKRVYVLALGDKRKAGTRRRGIVGGEDLVKKIADSDGLCSVATPDIMKSAGRLGKVRSPRTYTNAKANTVTFDVAGAVKEIKAAESSSVSTKRLSHTMR